MLAVQFPLALRRSTPHHRRRLPCRRCRLAAQDYEQISGDKGFWGMPMTLCRYRGAWIVLARGGSFYLCCFLSIYRNVFRHHFQLLCLPAIDTATLIEISASTIGLSYVALLFFSTSASWSQNEKKNYNNTTIPIVHSIVPASTSTSSSS